MNIACLIQDQQEALHLAYEAIEPRKAEHILLGDVIVPPAVIMNVKRFEMFELKEDE